MNGVIRKAIWGLSLLLLVFSSGTSSVKVYQITEVELTQLEQNLMEQEILLTQALTLQQLQTTELAALRKDLEKALSELQQSREEHRDY